MEKQKSYLEIILGPMFSGKTSALIEIYKQYTFCNIPVLVINHQEDIRYSNDASTMVTHDQKQITCIQSKDIQSVIENNHINFLQQQYAVLINEGQFFPDLYESVQTMLNTYNIHIYVAGLDGDFRQEKFGQMLDLIPLCDKVYKLHSLCVLCKNGTKAIFSHRTVTNCDDQKLVGANDTYIPLCRNCIQSSKKKTDV
jgi:thymidine kinase